jgi:uncharacterized protein (DUF2237 family)
MIAPRQLSPPGTTPPDSDARNVLGGPLQACSMEPLTGYTRTGCCETGPSDVGSHTVCAVMTDAFLAYSAAQGNELRVARPEWAFPGLKAGDRWCLCASRWAEAERAGAAPRVVLAATHEAALRTVSLESLQAHAVEAA